MKIVEQRILIKHFRHAESSHFCNFKCKSQSCGHFMACAPFHGISHSQKICAYFVYGIINKLPQSYDNPYKQSHLSSGRTVFGGSTKIMGLYHPQDPSRCPIGKIEFFIFMKDNSYSMEKLLWVLCYHQQLASHCPLQNDGRVASKKVHYRGHFLAIHIIVFFQKARWTSNVQHGTTAMKIYLILS